MRTAAVAVSLLPWETRVYTWGRLGPRKSERNEEL